MNKPVVILSGGFDPLHHGHIEMIKAAYQNGTNNVVILLNSDEWLVRKKGKSFMSWKDRFSVLNCLRYVYCVYSVDDSDGTVTKGLEFVRQVYSTRELFFGNGGDREEANVPEVLCCKENNINFLWDLGGNKIRSSSELLDNWKRDKTEREWGFWKVLGEYPHVKVKEMRVEPGQRLSYQKHNNRSELWFVAQGIATVNRWGDCIQVPQYSYVEIARKAWHQLINNEEDVLIVVEVQFGPICVESDIERKSEDAN